MFNKQHFCHVASNNRNEQKAGLFVYKTTDNLETVLASGYFNEKIIDINLHDLIIHEYHDPADRTKTQMNVLCVTERTLDNVGTKVILSNFEGEVESDLTDIENAITALQQADESFVKTDGSRIMSAPLRMIAGSMRGAIAPYWNGVGFFKVNNDEAQSVTLVASIDDHSGFVPATAGLKMGSANKKWGTIYTTALNNGYDIAVPVTNAADTLALKSQLDLAATSGVMITNQGVWYAKMETATVPPASAEVEGRNYADFSQVDGNNDPIIVIYTYTNGAWVQTETITPPSDYDGYVPVTSKIWDIPEQTDQQGGRILWNHVSQEFTPYPTIITFEGATINNGTLTGTSTVVMPENPGQNQIVNKDYVDEAIASIPTPTVDIKQSIDAEIVGTLTVADNGDVSGFSNSNYLLFPGDLDMTGANSFEIVASFTTSVNGLLVYLLAENPVSILSDKHLTFMASTHIRFDVNDGSNYQTLEGTTSLLANTKYYAKLTYDGTNYTLSLSTDGINYITEATATAQYIPGKITYEYLIGRASVGTQLHLSDYYIKKDGILVWQGLGDPGLHQRVVKGHEVIAFQAPTSNNNYTWYRKYADGWVEQGGYMVGSSATVYTVNLPITMADTNYTVMATLRSNTVSGGGGAWANANAYSTTQIQIVQDYKDTWVGRGSYWTVSGMAQS